MRFSLKALLSAAAILAAAASASATPIVTYDFNDLDSDPDFVAANMTASDFTAGTGLTNVTFAGGNAAARGWTQGGDSDAAISNNDYWAFTVTADSGFQFDLSNITLDEFREDFGPMMFQLWSDGSLVGSAMSTSYPSTTSHDVALSGTDLTNLEIRIYAWDSSGGNNPSKVPLQDWFVDNVILNGTVEAAASTAVVPEPVSILLLGTGLAGLVVRRRRTPANPASKK